MLFFINLFFISSLTLVTFPNLRLIAVAGKPLGRLNSLAISSMTRAAVESKLYLFGFLIFSNTLKLDTKNSIESLSSAGCRCIIAIGDSPLTAVAVAKECGIIKSSTAE